MGENWRTSVKRDRFSCGRKKPPCYTHHFGDYRLRTVCVESIRMGTAEISRQFRFLNGIAIRRTNPADGHSRLIGGLLLSNRCRFQWLVRNAKDTRATVLAIFLILVGLIPGFKLSYKPGSIHKEKSQGHVWIRVCLRFPNYWHRQDSSLAWVKGRSSIQGG